VHSDELVALSDQFYETVWDEGQWPAALAALRQEFSGTTAVLTVSNVETSDAVVYHTGEIDPEFNRSYFDVYSQHNLIIKGLEHEAAGLVYSDWSLVPRDELHRSVIWNEWMKPQDFYGLLGCKIGLAQDLVGSIHVQRSAKQGDFNESDLSRMRTLAPMFNDITELRDRFGAASLSREAETYSRLNVGFVVVDANGLMLHHNERAESFVNEANSGLSFARGHFRAGNSATAAQFRLLISEACLGKGGHMTTGAGTAGEPTLAISVAPLRDGYILALPVLRAAVVFIQELTARLPPNFESRIRAMFGLTRKEASIAAALVSGLTLKQAAEERSVSIATARSHLSELLHKTRTSQQSQLVSVLLGILPLGP
jgi:DNA-binding CsgD family transcriptional regulator